MTASPRIPMPKVMGILNVTPDSFSDGGEWFDVQQAVAQFETLVTAGAQAIDIGAESTRPGATPLDHAQEWVRLQPVLARIVTHPARQNIRISIDTRHAETAAKVLTMGVDIINDVGGLRDAEMRAVLAQSPCDIVVMHALGIPADAETLLTPDADPVAVILAWKQAVQQMVAQSGIALERVIFDPGVGFGKSPLHSLQLILHAPELIESGGRWLYGHSRKSFLTLFAESNASYEQSRDALTLAFSAQLAANGVHWLRAHDVAAHRQLLEKLCT